jgi:hypothetical protein
MNPMPAGSSVTKEQFERDLVRVDQEINEITSQMGALQCKLDDLTRQRDIIKGAIEMYFRSASQLPKIESALDHLSIAEACEAIFKELHNRWLSLSDLDTELRRHGKVCSKGSIEIMLKNAHGKFEVEKRGKKNFYRLVGVKNTLI